MGDEFAAHVEPLRRELLAHCYRMTGGLSDAEDALQNALVRAWKSFEGFEGRASMRTWIYRITTNACLDLIASRKARTMPELKDTDEIDPAWLEPMPPPDSQYASREAVRLAFIVALQVLPPRQRAALILRDVVGFSAEETAAALETTVAAINSALQRARAVLDEHPRAKRTPITGKLGALLGNYLRLWEAGDARGLVALLREDATFSMPPLPDWARGRDAIAALLESHVWPTGRSRPVACMVNGAPAFAMYQQGALRALTVLDIEDNQIVTMHSFLGVDAERYGLPPKLADDAVELLPGEHLGPFSLEHVLARHPPLTVWFANDRDAARDVVLLMPRDPYAMAAMGQNVRRVEVAGHNLITVTLDQGQPLASVDDLLLAIGA